MKQIKLIQTRYFPAILIMLFTLFLFSTNSSAYYPYDQPGVGSPGYWKNHPDAWPVYVIVIGEDEYRKKMALKYMKMPVKGDKTKTLFKAVVAAKLNVKIGNDSSCISNTIMMADMWFYKYGPVGSGVHASSEAWYKGEPIYQELDAYNNGYLCAPKRK